MNFIGLDIGSSFIKGAVLNLETHQLQQIHRQPFPNSIVGLPPRHFEVDPQQLVQQVRSVVEDLHTVAKNCAGLLLCSQMHGLVLTDSSWQPLSNVITWRDQRTTLPHFGRDKSIYEMMLEQITNEEQRQLGGGLRAGLPIFTLGWLAAHDKLPAGNVIPMSLPDFVLAQLCDSALSPGIEPTNAAAHGAYNIETADWHHPVIERLGLGNLQWPPMRTISDVVGVATINGKSLPCHAPIGDHQAALAGAFITDRELSLNIATGSQASLLANEVRYGEYEIRPFFDGQLLNTIVSIPAGRSLSLLVNLLTELARAEGIVLADPWATIGASVDAIEQTDLSVNMDFYAGTTPSLANISNIRGDNLSVGHLFRAAFQRMADDYTDCAKRLSPDDEWERIVFSGGLAQKLVSLRELILAKFDHEYRICQSTEDSLLGLMTLALVASGKAESVAEAMRLITTDDEWPAE